MQELGDFLKAQREAKGWGIREAAKFLGITHSRLIEIERGQSYTTNNETRPSRERVEKFAEVYGLSLDLLLSLAGYDPSATSDLTAEEHQAVILFRKIAPDRRKMALGMLRLIAEDDQSEPPKG